jgi:hypothetical protein
MSDDMHESFIVSERWVISGNSRRLKRIAGVALALMLVAPLWGKAVEYDPRVVPMLPLYCKRDVTGRPFSPDEEQRWRSALGVDLIHIHHYCRGLQLTHHALFFARDSRERLRNLRYSLAEFEYVLGNATPNFILRPEILTKKGENLILLDSGVQAITPLRQAIQLKPDYWPPYVALSDYYKKTGDRAQAKEWLEKGLAVAPNVKTMKARLVELEGSAAKVKSAPPAQQPAKSPPAAAEPPAGKDSSKPSPDEALPSAER